MAATVRPAFALAAVLCTFGLEQWAQSQHGFFFSHQTLTNYLTGSVLVWALAVKFVRGGGLLRPYPTTGWLVLALFTWAVISFFWSVYPSGTMAQLQKAAPYVASVVLLCPLLVSKPQDLRSGFMATLAFGTAILTLLLLQTEWEGRSITLARDDFTMGRVISDRGNPLAVASLAGYVGLIALLLNFSGLARVWQLARWVVVAVALIAAIRSGSRGQFIALLLAGVALLPVSRRIRSFKGFFATAAGVVMTLLLVQWVFQSYAAGSARWDLENMIQAYTGGRLGMAGVVLSAWLEAGPVHWVIGLGSSASFSPDIVGFYPHLVAAEILAEEGLVGFVLLGLIGLFSVLALRRTYLMVQDDPIRRGTLAAVSGLLLFEAILSFKQGSMLAMPHLWAFAIILGRYHLAVAQEQDQLLAAESLTDDQWPAAQEPADAGQFGGYERERLFN